MITADPRDKYFEKLKKLKGVTYQGRGFYIIPGKLLQGSVGIGRYREVKKRTNRYELSAMGDLVGWGSGHEHQNDYRLKDWEEAMKETNNQSISSKLTEAANSIMEVHNNTPTYPNFPNYKKEVLGNTPNYKEVEGHTEVEFVLDGRVIASKFYLTKDRIHQKFIKLWMEYIQTPDGKFYRGEPTTRINGKVKGEPYHRY